MRRVCVFLRLLINGFPVSRISRLRLLTFERIDKAWRRDQTFTLYIHQVRFREHTTPTKERTTGSKEEKRYLFQMSFGRAEEDDGEITGGCGRHGRQQDVVHGADGTLDHRFPAAQRSIDIQTAEILSDRLQFL